MHFGHLFGRAGVPGTEWALSEGRAELLVLIPVVVEVDDIQKPRGLATINTIDMETEPSEIQFKNGSDHAVVANYSELYVEGDV